MVMAVVMAINRENIGYRRKAADFNIDSPSTVTNITMEIRFSNRSTFLYTLDFLMDLFPFLLFFQSLQQVFLA